MVAVGTPQSRRNRPGRSPSQLAAEPARAPRPPLAAGVRRGHVASPARPRRRCPAPRCRTRPRCARPARRAGIRIQRLQRVPGAPIAVAAVVHRPSSRPSVNRQAAAPAGSTTLVWPHPGGHAHPDRRRGARRHRLERRGAEDHRSRHPGAGVGQAGRDPVEDGERRAGVVRPQWRSSTSAATWRALRGASPPSRYARSTWRIVRRQPSARRPLGRHPADDHPQPLLVQREHVVEVAARRAARGRAVGDATRQPRRRSGSGASGSSADWSSPTSCSSASRWRASRRARRRVSDGGTPAPASESPASPAISAHMNPGTTHTASRTERTTCG